MLFAAAKAKRNDAGSVAGSPADGASNPTAAVGSPADGASNPSAAVGSPDAELQRI
jgi:hypothetical protein